MPEHDCEPCRYKVEGEEVDEVVDGWCCGGYPVTLVGSDYAFLAKGYSCSDDGWLQFKCHRDMCCSHPDDVPIGVTGIFTTGTTCSAQGWYDSDKRGDCQRSLGLAGSDPNGCVKKEQCATGLCMPWPHYCWKAPYAPTGGGSGGGDGGGGGQQGVTCSAQGWYDSDKRGDCQRSIGLPESSPEGCVKKEQCGAGQCQPWPNYCWKAPYVPGPPPPPPDDPPPPPPTGVECSAKGWWNGDDLEGCESTHGK